MVGAVRFELTTSCTPSKRALQAAPRPDPLQLIQLTEDILVLLRRFSTRKRRVIKHAQHRMVPNQPVHSTIGQYAFVDQRKPAYQKPNWFTPCFPRLNGGRRTGGITPLIKPISLIGKCHILMPTLRRCQTAETLRTRRYGWLGPSKARHETSRPCQKKIAVGTDEWSRVSVRLPFTKSTGARPSRSQKACGQDGRAPRHGNRCATTPTGQPTEPALPNAPVIWDAWPHASTSLTQRRQDATGIEP